MSKLQRGRVRLNAETRSAVEAVAEAILLQRGRVRLNAETRHGCRNRF